MNIFKQKEREIILFKKNIWGMAFYIDNPDIVKIKDKCEGHGFYPQRSKIKKGVLVCKLFDDGLAVIEITNIKYYSDPRDMFFWEGVRISVKDLTKAEEIIVEDLLK